MHIQFDTNLTTYEEAKGLISLLLALFPTLATVNLATPQYPTPTTEEQAVFGVPVQPTPVDVPTQAPGPALVDSESTPAEAPKRTRRTKAQIEADEAAQATSTDPTQGSAAPTAVASSTIQSANVQASIAPAPGKPISADELRALLNGYISKHSMEDAIAKLREFGCNRVTEALSLEPAKLNELAAALNG